MEQQKIIVGISGGVDSAVTASLLKDAGHEVIAVFLNFSDSELAKTSLNDARKIADFLKIQLHIIDKTEEFRNNIIKPFVESYCSGMTPNPCCLCNPNMKFHSLIEFAKKANADLIATGHYARIAKMPDGTHFLIPAKDPKRDQSYFLAGLEQKILDKLKFPLGEWEKTEVRKYAEQNKIPVASKSDSQDICFLSSYNGNYFEFIKEYIKKYSSDFSPPSGDILDKNGHLLGKHDGIEKYTVGQRKGLGVSAKEPLYVFKIQENNVYIGPKENLAVKEIKLKNVNISHFGELYFGDQEERDAFIQIRSTTPSVPCVVYRVAFNLLKIIFKVEQHGVSPGQTGVIRNKDGVVLAGGIITNN